MLLSSITVAAFFLTIMFGIQYRMVRNPLARKAGQALMNVFMGVTLILFATNQFLFPDMTAVRLIVGSIIGLLGLLNLVMGIKNYRFYRSNLS
jgi:hypothetical protein